MQEKTGSTTLKIQTKGDRQDSFIQSPYKRDSLLMSPVKSVFTPHEVRLSKLKLNLEKATIQDNNPDKQDELASKVDKPKLTLIERVAKALRKKLIKEKVIEPNSDDSEYAVSEKSQEESHPQGASQSNINKGSLSNSVAPSRSNLNKSTLTSSTKLMK